MTPRPQGMITTSGRPGVDRRAPALRTLGVAVAVATCTLAFVAVDQAYVGFVDARFPAVGSSMSLATLYGVVSRLHLIIPLTMLAVWRPRTLGFQMGQTRRHLRLLTLLLVANVGTVAAYLLLSRGTTPYSGHQWLFTEVVTVPVVEEVMWRGLVFAVLLSALRPAQPQRAATTTAVWLSGLAFGLAHGANVLVGLPMAFVAIQVLNATVWGVVYGYSRVRTDSIYPPIVLHAAMNLTVVLL